MAPDGKSLITSVGSQDHTVWLHDKDGDHQISSEGDASSPIFSPDGRSLYFLMAKGQTLDAELWVKDLNTGKLDRVLPDYTIQSHTIARQTYTISPDGKQIAFVMNDQSGRSGLWIAPTNRRSSPRHLSSSAIEDNPIFLPDGDLLFRAVEGGSNFIYRMKPDGTDRRKIIPDRILDIKNISPDGRWVVATVSNSDSDPEHTVIAIAIPIHGGTSVRLCDIYCEISWDATGKVVYFFSDPLYGGTYLLPVMPNGLPKVPSGGLARSEDVANEKKIPQYVQSALSPSVYAYTQQNTRRNLYRIPLL